MTGYHHPSRLHVPVLLCPLPGSWYVTGGNFRPSEMLRKWQVRLLQSYTENVSVMARFKLLCEYPDRWPSFHEARELKVKEVVIIIKAVEVSYTEWRCTWHKWSHLIETQRIIHTYLNVRPRCQPQSSLHTPTAPLLLSVLLGQQWTIGPTQYTNYRCTSNLLSHSKMEFPGTQHQILNKRWSLDRMWCPEINTDTPFRILYVLSMRIDHTRSDRCPSAYSTWKSRAAEIATRGARTSGGAAAGAHSSVGRREWATGTRAGGEHYWWLFN